MDLPRLTPQRRALLTEATERYSEALEGSEAADYLEGRGFTLEVAQSFQLGFVADPLEGHERFRGRIAIPYLTPSGTVGMRFRYAHDDLAENENKYDSDQGQRTALYNVPDLHKTDPWIAICEGEPDTWTMSGVVGVPAVGIPGVKHWLQKGAVWGRLFQDYESVFVLMDPDEAGRKIIREITDQVENPIVIDLPADVNDTVKKKGADWLLHQMGLD